MNYNNITDYQERKNSIDRMLNEIMHLDKPQETHTIMMKLLDILFIMNQLNNEIEYLKHSFKSLRETQI